MASKKNQIIDKKILKPSLNTVIKNNININSKPINEEKKKVVLKNESDDESNNESDNGDGDGDDDEEDEEDEDDTNKIDSNYNSDNDNEIEESNTNKTKENDEDDDDNDDEDNQNDDDNNDNNNESKTNINNLEGDNIDLTDCLLDEEEIDNEVEDPILVDENKRVSFPKLTKYERVRILATRTKQLALGAPPFVKNIVNKSPIEIAIIELNHNMIPFLIKRTMPNNTYEIWKLSELDK